MAHALRRTSPKGPGQKFIGTCTKCGIENIPVERMHEECANPANFTQDETLLLAINALTPDTDKENSRG